MVSSLNLELSGWPHCRASKFWDSACFCPESVQIGGASQIVALNIQTTAVAWVAGREARAAAVKGFLTSLARLDSHVVRLPVQSAVLAHTGQGRVWLLLGPVWLLLLTPGSLFPAGICALPAG